MKISDTCIYGLEAAVAASRLPFMEPGAPADAQMASAAEIALGRGGDRSIGRAAKLAAAPPGSGHDNFLCGIVVQATVTAPRYWWPELQRYHFVDIVSSTSTMHTLVRLLEEHRGADALYRECFVESTPPEMVRAFVAAAERLLSAGAGKDALKSALPEGFLQTARIVTNYRQLKTIYAQRRSHELREWRDFCEWVRGLRYSEWLV